MSLANFFIVSSYGTFFLLPLFLMRHGGSKADIGIVMGVFSFSSVLCRPWISAMVDRIGRKKSYMLGCLTLTIFPMAYLFFDGELNTFYAPLLLIRIAHGIGLAIAFTSSFIYIADITPEGRLNEGIAMFGVTGLTGMAVGPVIAEFILQRLGFSALFLFASATAGMGFLLQTPLPESYLKRTKSSQSFSQVLRKKKTLHVALLFFLFGIGLAASGSFVSPFAKHLNLSFVSLYFVAYCSAAIMTRLLGSRIADRVGERRIIPHALLVTGCGMLLMTFLQGNLILFTSGFMSGCGHGFLFPSLSALALRHEPIELRGKVTAIFTGALDGGVFAGSILLGYVGEWAGFRAIFVLAAASLFLGFIVQKYAKVNGKGPSPMTF